MPNTIDAAMLKKMFLAGTKNLESNQGWINELNVFPVPDGDTGTNMTLTLMAAVSELKDLKEKTNLSEIAGCISTGSLKGARGNSGVIMSQLCRGFSKEIEGKRRLDIKALTKAFDGAQIAAYQAVMDPKEGTILTIAREITARAEELSREKKLSLEDFLKQILQHAEVVLKNTPDMLPVLKEAGVVDSGGQGLVEFLRGANEAFLGNEIDYSFEEIAAAGKKSVARVKITDIETADIKFGYCTEFIINAEEALSEDDEKELKRYLSSLGDSLVCVCMDNIIKIHVHTNEPGTVIQKGLELGELSSIKIDNMRKEHSERVIKDVDKHLKVQADMERAAREAKRKKKSAPAPKREYGFVAVCAGDGIANIFKNMSVDEIIEGGQTMNPSTKDILSVIDKVNADNVYVLPNNGNIILAAEQAKELCKDKNVYVIPTKTITQGINAVINYVPAMSIEENAKRMTDSIDDIKTAEITYAVRNTKIDGIKIEKGDYMSIGDSGLLSCGKDIESVVAESIEKLFDEDSEIITVYYGEDVDTKDAENMGELLEEKSGDAEVDVVYGGQPVYYYIISVE